MQQIIWMRVRMKLSKNIRNYPQRVCFAVLAIMLGLILTSCSGLPTSGDVQIAERAVQSEGKVVLDPKGPLKGATAEQVIAGFLRASSVGISDDFKAARQFLTQEMSANWNPLTTVRIYPDSQTFSSSQTPSGAFRVSVPALGTIDADGLYTSASQESQIAAEFSLIRNPDGEWRIAVLDDGLIMSRSLFDSLYVEAPLYFPSSSGRSMIADVRWYPRQGLAGSIARGLAKGPAKWLAAAVRTVLPPDVVVAGTQVRATDSVAVVDFSSGATALPQETIATLQAQYRLSFSAANVAQDAVLTASGVQISGETSQEFTTYPLQESPVIALRNDAVVRVSRKTQEFTELISGTFTKGLGLADLALSYGEDLHYGAALGNDSKVLYQLNFGDGSLHDVLRGNNLIPPSIDSAGWIWSGERTSAGELAVIDSGSGRVEKVHVPELSGANIDFVKISREGSRAVIVYNRDGKTVICAAALVRSSSGQPQQLGEFMPFAQRLADVNDLVWTGDAELMVLGRYALNSSESLVEVQIGGPDESLNVMDGAVEITGARGENSVLLADKMGVLYEYASGAWRKFAEGVSSPAMAG
ncbi:LpqB family beta-propeller domain-containing protein [Arcanobacterium hippocoleae]